MKNKNTIAEKMYAMQLHDEIEDGVLTITRVIGGWIYEIPRGNTERVTSQFIPFSTEFMNK